MLSDGPGTYGYAGQRPNVFVDPTGRIVPVAIGIIAGLGAFGFADYANAPGRGDTIRPAEPLGPLYQGGAAAAAAPLPMQGLIGASLGAGAGFGVESTRNACGYPPNTGTLGVAGHTAVGAALGMSGPFGRKGRTGIAGGGPSGNKTSGLSQATGRAYREGLIGLEMRNRMRSISRQLSDRRIAALGIGAVLALDAYEILNCGK